MMVTISSSKMLNGHIHKLRSQCAPLNISSSMFKQFQKAYMTMQGWPNDA